MHPTMTRLYEAAAQLRDATTLTEVAALLGESPQTVKNWEDRGMSAAAMIKAEEEIGCRAVWLKSGNAPMTWMARVAMTGMSRDEAKVARQLMDAFEQAGTAKREALLKLSALPEQEMATLLLVLQSIGEKYKS
jgi:hypothetical protein